MISVIMPVYNQLIHLGHSIESLLAQTVSEFELIIIDDASSEPIQDLLRGYADQDPRIRLYQNRENLGLTKSLNVALDLARGDFIARHDADDTCDPQRFEKQLQAFEPGVGLVTCWASAMDREGATIESNYERKCELAGREAKRIVLSRKRHALIDPSAIYSREAVDKVGYYDERFEFGQSYNYILRVLQYFDLRVVTEHLYHRRKDTSAKVRKLDVEGLIRRADESPIISVRP
jgi:glycosyltransferase involved in cell wall biosynthesis